jgi:hypothetical protein
MLLIGIILIHFGYKDYSNGKFLKKFKEAHINFAVLLTVRKNINLMNNKSEQHRGLKLTSQIQSIRLVIEVKQ